VPHLRWIASTINPLEKAAFKRRSMPKKLLAGSHLTAGLDPLPGVSPKGGVLLAVSKAWDPHHHFFVGKKFVWTHLRKAPYCGEVGSRMCWQK